MTYSVALCSYNGARYVGEQIQSILDQSNPPDQIVFRDDASTDETCQVAMALLSSFKGELDFKARKTNMGLVANFSDTLSACASPVVFLCDQDDVWLKDRAARMMESLRVQEGLFLFSEAALVGPGLEPKGSLLDAMGVDVDYVEDLRRAGMDSFLGLLRQPRATGAASCVSSELLQWALPIPAEGWFHDEWLAFCAALAGRLRCLQSPTVLYRQHGGNQVGASSNKWSLAPYVKRVSKLRDRAHGLMLGKKAEALLERLDELSDGARASSLDGATMARVGLAKQWCGYLRGRSTGHWGAAAMDYAMFSQHPSLAWALDMAERACSSSASKEGA